MVISFKGYKPLNCGISAHCAQNILRQSNALFTPSFLRYVLVHCGTNSLAYDVPKEVINAIIKIGKTFKQNRQEYKLICQVFDHAI